MSYSISVMLESRTSPETPCTTNSRTSPHPKTFNGHVKAFPPIVVPTRCNSQADPEMTLPDSLGAGSDGKRPSRRRCPWKAVPCKGLRLAAAPRDARKPWRRRRENEAVSSCIDDVSALLLLRFVHKEKACLLLHAAQGEGHHQSIRPEHQ